MGNMSIIIITSTSNNMLYTFLIFHQSLDNSHCIYYFIVIVERP